MIFDQPPAELPIATLRPRESGAQLSIDVRNWFAARWRWLRPRTIPVLVAFAGMIAVLASASYLRSFAHEPPEQLTARPLQLHLASNEPTTTATYPGILHVETGPAAAVTVLETGGKPLAIKPGVYRIVLTPR
jgi:hypothetical protein